VQGDSTTVTFRVTIDSGISGILENQARITAQGLPALRDCRANSIEFWNSAGSRTRRLVSARRLTLFRAGRALTGSTNHAICDEHERDADKDHHEGLRRLIAQ